MPKHKPPPWMKATSPPARTHVGVPWYTEDQWAKVKAAATDPDRFELTYKQWLQKAEDSLRKSRTLGVVAKKVSIGCDELLAWCSMHKKENNADARSQFASEHSARRHDAGI
jgi:hypothetical protein